MEAQPVHDYIIPVEDSKFLLLPDKQEVTFSNLGELSRHVQDEIAAWTNVDNTIVDKYKLVLGKIENVVQGVKDGRIAPGALVEVKNLLQGWTVNQGGINSCIYSRSRLGRYLHELKDRCENTQAFHEYSLLTILVVGCPAPKLSFYLPVFNLSLEAARASKYFGCPEDLSARIEEYKMRLEDLSNSADVQTQGYKSRILQFDTYTEEFKQKRREELDKEEHEYEERLNRADEKITALEAAYSKKLQLEGPAQHWNNLAQSYLYRGWLLLLMTLLVGACVITCLLNVLFNVDSISLFNQTKLNLMTIRGSLILIVLTSIAGYLLHLFTKLAISCFHLSRDYRERFQLTNVFLALLRDGDVKCDDQVKQIVMQALFSRSDTGLLKGEHSFMMPGVPEVLKSGD